MDDAALLANYVHTGSQQDFATLVNRHANWVYTVCRRHAGDALAEDVTQAVFATLARKAPHLRPGASISGWLFKTARYASATARKIEYRRRKHERRAAAMKSEQTPPPADQDWQQILPQLDDAVARLPKRDSRLILLRFYQGLSHQEAATILGISPAAAQRRLSRAIEKLRARLKHFPLVLSPGAFERGLEHQVITTAPGHVVSVSISVTSAAPSAQAELIMKGAVIMKRLHILKMAGAATCLLALLALAGIAVWLVLPAKAAAPVADASQPAQPTGVTTVEFHIVADTVTVNASDLTTMDSRLETGGPGPLPQPGDTMRWIEVEHPEDFDQPGLPPETLAWNGSHFLPVLVTPDASMDHTSTPAWSFVDARESTASNGSRAVSVTLDPRGTKLLGELTTHWYDLASQRKDIPHPRARLAIIVENKTISAPKLGGPLTSGSAMITGGGRGGLNEEETTRLISAIIPPTTEPSTAAMR
ncbi:MAG: sigma-70 family RNA polymerase sigma factor [Tepidisphaeraceae bacterium]|jgi:RNA polymerase sigma factor (sigma-70 family)